MTIQQAYQQLLMQLYELYEPGEATNIADMVIEHLAGFRKIDRIANKAFPLNEQQEIDLQKLTAELMQHKPVQYAIGEAWFMNMKLRVNEHVLIPRPETEELVDWVINDMRSMNQNDGSLLDIGTGSGCIPIAIKKNQPHTEVAATDISEDALQVAKINSIEQNTLVDFLHADILNEADWKQLGHYDIIVSNPPYIAQSEQQAMNKNVFDYEPHIALFVPDNDVLLFYKAIAQFSKNHLKPGGKIYVEVNETLGEQTVQLFLQNGFKNVELKKDMQGKDRMIKAG